MGMCLKHVLMPNTQEQLRAVQSFLWPAAATEETKYGDEQRGKEGVKKSGIVLQTENKSEQM